VEPLVFNTKKEVYQNDANQLFFQTKQKPQLIFKY